MWGKIYFGAGNVVKYDANRKIFYLDQERAREILSEDRRIKKMITPHNESSLVGVLLLVYAVE